jgi:hypothetical protein
MSKCAAQISSVEIAISAFKAVEAVVKEERKERESAQLAEFLKLRFRD